MLGKFSSFFLNRSIVFILGVVVGGGLSLVITRVPKDFFFKEEAPKEVRELDPFADFEVPMNDRINAKIRNYTRPNMKAGLLESYKRSGKYLLMIQAIFEEYNLPQYLAYLPILESAFEPNSLSRAGAVGLWQIMPATAMDYGLKVNRWIDERRDPEKSTIVAAEYLQFLYARFGDWELALAAYNCGFPKLIRAMKREKVVNYWQIRRIPRETYNFVPKFYAILHIFSDPEKYGVKLPEKNKPWDYETIEIEATFSIDQIARLADVPPNVIKSFNPALTAKIAPSGKYSIKVPVGVKEHFMQEYKDNPPEQIQITYETYRVRRGDTLSKIAKRFGTSVRAIKADNNLRSSRWIKTGKKLRIASVTVIKESVPDETELADAKVEIDSVYTPPRNQLRFLYRVERTGLSLNVLARYYSVTADEIRKWNPLIRVDDLQKGEQLRIYKRKDLAVFHRTRRGDSLWRLARKYNTTVSNLRRWNQVRGSKIYPGSRLVVGLR